MLRQRLAAIIGLLGLSCLLCAAVTYSRYVDWPSLGGEGAVRAYVPARYPLTDAHHYTFANFMDTWELYRFTTTPEAVTFVAESLQLGAPTTVHEFPLIISRPPPFWWHPELLPDAQLYRSPHRAPDGHLYDLLYSLETGIAYLVQYDG